MRLSHLMGQVWACLLSLLLFVSTVRAQNKPYSGVADTLIEGTWSSGTGAVTTGPEFYNLVNNTFNVPSVPGQAYSFHMINKTHGYWEQALYIIQSNGTRPLGCYTAQLIWQHGNYTIFPDTSIRLDPFTADGRMQLLDTCGTNPNKIYYYSQSEVMKGYDITTYIHYNEPTYKLQLYQFDGQLKPPMYLRYKPPQMMPTQGLHMIMYGLM